MKLLLTLLLLVLPVSAKANRVVIDELRKLKASLPVNDPARKEITLRLADRISDEYLASKDESQKRTEADRAEALALYRESLASRTGEMKNKIQFQMARLYAEKSSDLGSAKGLFEEVRMNSQVKELKRESNLRLAEMAEASPATASAAVKYYREALTLCEGTDSCSYSHYRLGWIERNNENLPKAIEEMKLALWDSKGQLREEAMRDLVSFMGLASTQVEQSIPYLDQLSTKVSRPALLQDLAYAYFAAGNKAAGVKVLALTHSRAPTLYSEMRLMEEYYGLRQWDQFRSILAQFDATVHAGASNAESSKDLIEIEKIGRRLATQLDGERTTDPTRFEDFKQFTLSYLDLFPRATERAKIMEGLIAAEPNRDLKLTQLKNWLSAIQFDLPLSDEVKLRELRAAIAQKEPVNHSVVIEEMTALMAKNQSKAREYRYVRARAYYAQKDFTQAAPEFVELAAVQSTPDSFAIQSQHLLLDIYNQQKDLAKIVAQAKTWTTNESLIKNTKISADLKEMSQIAEQAEFESATQQNESIESLNVFMNYCQNGKFLPKSCENAKVLSVKLNQHLKLISILELQSKTDASIHSELMNEYEAGAYFVKAADMMSKAFAKTPEFKTQVKTAVLYEVGRDLAKRNMTLNQLTQLVLTKKIKLAAPEEKALIAFLVDTRLLNPALLTVVSADSKVSLSENLEEQGLGNKQTQQILMSQNDYQGIAWAKHVISKAEELSAAEAKIKFYGRNGQVAFQKRVNRLKELNQFSDQYLNGSDALTRTKLLTVLKTSHERIATEIMESPLPANLNEEQVAQVKVSLAEMAKPFQDKVESLKKLMETEEQKVSLSLTQSSSKPSFDENSYQEAINLLHQNPKNGAALTQLKTLFTNAGLNRPAAYFEGRIQGL